MHHFRKIAIAGLATWLIFGVGLYLTLRYGAGLVLAQAPVISIIPQPDAPIRISLGKVVSDNPSAPAFEYSIVNVSHKPIRAHALRIDDGLRGSLLSILTFPLQSGQTQPGTYGDKTSSPPPKGIEMSVDFVEFVDGTTWGPDTTNAAERVAGHYAGRRAERDRLLKLLEEGGTQAVISAIEADDVQIVPQSRRSERWEENYRLGVKYYGLGVRRTYKNEGVAAMDTSLRKELNQK
jgi:hypothetical protein